MTRAPSSADKHMVREVFYTTPFIERGQPFLPEMLWVLQGRQDLERHQKSLPEYCYNIFDVFQRTYFKGFPLLSETVQVIDPAGLETARTTEAVKKVLRLDWKNLGRMASSIPSRATSPRSARRGRIILWDNFPGCSLLASPARTSNPGLISFAPSGLRFDWQEFQKIRVHLC